MTKLQHNLLRSATQKQPPLIVPSAARPSDQRFGPPATDARKRFKRANDPPCSAKVLQDPIATPWSLHPEEGQTKRQVQSATIISPHDSSQMRPQAITLPSMFTQVAKSQVRHIPTTRLLLPRRPAYLFSNQALPSRLGHPIPTPQLKTTSTPRAILRGPASF